MAREVEVTREQMQAICSATIGAARVRLGYRRTALEREMRRVAREADRVAVNWRTGECGCLIGTLRMERGLDPRPSLNYWGDQALGLGSATTEDERVYGDSLLDGIERVLGRPRYSGHVLVVKS